MNMLTKLKKELRKYAQPDKAAFFPYFFKTGKGEYGEGDKFIGVTVPNSRKVAKQFRNLPFPQLKQLLKSKIHEERLTACLILVQKYEEGEVKEQQQVVKFYLQNSKGINNWDLVDLSAPKVLGEWMLDKAKDRGRLYRFSKSKNLWERRIAIVATYAFIKNGKFADAVGISKILMQDTHDLIHKAVGWMLREIGKKDRRILENFLDKHAKHMPRTMLRYAIERFPEKKRRGYLKGENLWKEGSYMNKRKRI